MPKATLNDTYFFTQVEHNILRSVCYYMIGPPNDPALELPIIRIDAFVQELPKPLRTRIRLGIHLFQWGPLLFIGKLCVFTRLDTGDAVRYIDSWAQSRFSIRRQLFRGLRDIAFLGYYSAG